jgi:hypothetical protein
MIYFKVPKTPEEVSAIYKSIQDELVEFEPNETVEELSKSYALAQEEIINELSAKF